MESIDGGEEGRADAKRNKSLGDLVSDETGFADAGEEDGAGGVEEGAGEGEGLGVIDVVEEEVEMAPLRFEEIDKGVFVNVAIFFL
jgi:hypothetical protein